MLNPGYRRTLVGLKRDRWASQRDPDEQFQTNLCGVEAAICAIGRAGCGRLQTNPCVGLKRRLQLQWPNLETVTAEPLWG